MRRYWRDYEQCALVSESLLGGVLMFTGSSTLMGFLVFEGVRIEDK